MTKKFIVGFDPNNPHDRRSSFVFPILIDNNFLFLDLHSGKTYTHGMIVFCGTEINYSNLLSKFKSCSHSFEIPLIQDFDSFVQVIKDYKIGNILMILNTINPDGLPAYTKVKKNSSISQSLP